MNFSSSGSSNPPPGTYYNNYNNPYSPVYSNPSSTGFGYSPSSWPAPPDAGEDPKKDPAYVYNGVYGDSDPHPPPFRPPSEEEKSSGEKQRGEDDSKGNEMLALGGEQDNNSSSSPLGSNEDSPSSHKHLGGGMEEDKKPMDYRRAAQENSNELLSDLSKFDDKQQQELLSNNNNEEYHQLGSDLDKGGPVGLPYDHQHPHLSHDDWLAANSHLQGSGGPMQQHGFPMGMGAYGQQQQQQQQQPMWNYYNSYPPGGSHHAPPVQDRFMESWWNYGHPPPLPQQQTTTSNALATGLQPPPPGSWALRGPRPSPRGGSERRGPGRPRLSASNKVPGSPGGSGDPSSPSGSSPRIPPASPLNYPYSSSELSPGEDSEAGGRKRGPGRPRIGLVDGMDGGLGSNILEELGAPPHHAPSSSLPSSGNPPASGSSGGKSKGSSNSASSNKKRYVCEICQKRFSTAWYVRVHRKSHNGERPYICHNCGKGFMLPNVLQVHLRKCEKTAGNLRPESALSRPSSNASPSLQAASSNTNHIAVVGQDSGSPLPQQHVPYPPPPDIYGGLYNQRFQSPNEPLGYGMIHGDPGPPVSSSSGVHIPPMNTYESSSIPPGSGGYPNERSPYGSPLFSPSHHFLANDRPPDKGGGHLPSPSSSSSSGPHPAGGSSSSNSSNPNTTSSYPLSCHACDSLFESQSSLEDHYPCSPSLSCSFCDKTFGDKGDFEAHLPSAHGICPVCSERFPFKSSLLSHMETIHDKYMLENHRIASEMAGHSTGPGLSGAAILLETEEAGVSSPPSQKQQQINPTAPSSGGAPGGGTGTSSTDLSSKLTQQTPLAMS